jgi:hypothetical protein
LRISLQIRERIIVRNKLLRALCLASGLAFAATGLSSTAAFAENPNLTQADRGPCRDPWINYAYRTQWNRQPVGAGDAGECVIYLYVGGHWQNYDQLRDGVGRFVRATQNAGQYMQGFGGVFRLVSRQTGGVFNALIRAGAQVYNMMGQPQPPNNYSLQGAGRQQDLGGGSVLIVN